jgi:hypothetical protein
MNQLMRIWSSKQGQGDSVNYCKPPVHPVNSSNGVLYSELRIINWQFVPCIDMPQGNHSVLTNDLSKMLCNGKFD